MPEESFKSIGRWKPPMRGSASAAITIQKQMHAIQIQIFLARILAALCHQSAWGFVESEYLAECTDFENVGFIERS